MGHEGTKSTIADDAIDDAELEEPLEPLRRRRASSVRFPEPREVVPPPRRGGPQPLTDEHRLSLWLAVRAVLFEESFEDPRANDATLSSAPRPSAPKGRDGAPDARGEKAAERERFRPRLVAPSSPARPFSSPALRRVWSAPPIGAMADRIPHDAAKLLQSWLALVEEADVYRFLEAVHDALEATEQPRFAAAINALLERASVAHRFVLRRLLPIESRSDIAAIERSLAACRSARWGSVEADLLDALGRLAVKPEPEARAAVAAATRAVQRAATALTRASFVDFEDALHGLEAHGHIERTLRAAYAGLFDFVHATRKTTTDDARLIVVMCAGFVSHLASRLG